jgi:hypothetical protein
VASIIDCNFLCRVYALPPRSDKVWNIFGFGIVDQREEMRVRLGTAKPASVGLAEAGCVAADVPFGPIGYGTLISSWAWIASRLFATANQGSSGGTPVRGSMPAIVVWRRFIVAECRIVQARFNLR